MKKKGSGGEVENSKGGMTGVAGDDHGNFFFLQKKKSSFSFHFRNL